MVARHVVDARVVDAALQLAVRAIETFHENVDCALAVGRIILHLFSCKVGSMVV